jgi:hypothetical protein
MNYLIALGTSEAIVGDEKTTLKSASRRGVLFALRCVSSSPLRVFGPRLRLTCETLTAYLGTSVLTVALAYCHAASCSTLSSEEC